MFIDMFVYGQNHEKKHHTPLSIVSVFQVFGNMVTGVSGGNQFFLKRRGIGSLGSLTEGQ